MLFVAILKSDISLICQVCYHFFIQEGYLFFFFFFLVPWVSQDCRNGFKQEADKKRCESPGYANTRAIYFLRELDCGNTLAPCMLCLQFGG